MAEVRAITPSRRGCSRPNWVIISSVRPSAKYSCSGSPLRLWKGSTASITLPVAGRGRQKKRAPPTNAIRAAAKAAGSSQRRRGDGARNR
ncbi:MAG: hypothetical protein HYR60_01345 [Acidobacteria bacterium]|nr:hypothetical protein [Acidobacteriota bacterium]